MMMKYLLQQISGLLTPAGSTIEMKSISLSTLLDDSPPCQLSPEEAFDNEDCVRVEQSSTSTHYYTYYPLALDLKSKSPRVSPTKLWSKIGWIIFYLAYRMQLRFDSIRFDLKHALYNITSIK